MRNNHVAIFNRGVEFKIENFARIRVLVTFVSLCFIFIYSFIYYNFTICPIEIREILIRQVDLRNPAGYRL